MGALRLSSGILAFALLSACSLVAVVGDLHPAAGQSTQDTDKASSLLLRHCAKCHGQNNAPNLNLFNLNERAGMLQKRQLVPGRPESSRIYIRAALSPNDGPTLARGQGQLTFSTTTRQDGLSAAYPRTAHGIAIPSCWIPD